MVDTYDSLLESFREQNLLIVASAYPGRDESVMGIFIKHQVAELKEYFKKVIIIAPVFHSFGFLKKNRICHDYTSVSYTHLTLPTNREV